jgi:signal recognition particle subunit SRP54
MVLDALGESLKNTLSKIAGSIFVDEKLINELVKDLQKALLKSDVNVKLVFDLTNRIKSRVLKEDMPKGLTKKEFLINVLYEELTNFLGKEQVELKIENKKPFKIMLVGLFGNGKTTTAAKLAKYYQKRGYKIALMSTDTWRPAAFKQLEQLGAQINVPVFGNPKLKDPLKIYKEFENELSKYSLVIIDTAGRDALNDELVKELNAINTYIKPDERLLVINADVGQAAQKQAETFHSTCNITGVIITKLDGTAKGGGALSACSVTNAPVKFIGVGEKIDDIETFEPKRFVGRLLGMGDIQTLLEKAKDAITTEDAEDLSKKLMKGEFSLIDLYDQMDAMRKMGPIDKIMEMIPGMSQIKLPKDALKVQEEKLKKWKYIMQSCTKDELEDPDSITSTRIDRIAKGSGTDPAEVRELLKQYKQSKKMLKMFGPNASDRNMKKFMGKMKGKFPGM